MSEATAGNSLERVFAKTDTGRRALLGQSVLLDQSARRILILVDGKRTLADLPQFARAGEIERIIDELTARGLIEQVGVAALPSADEQRRRRLAEQALLADVKAQLRGVFETELGAAGQIWEARVSDCVSADVLRRVLREAIDVLYFRSGEPAARRVVAMVKPLFRGTAPGS